MRKDIIVELPLRVRFDNNGSNVWSQTEKPYNGRFTRAQRVTCRLILSESPKKNQRRSREGDATVYPYSYSGSGPYRGEWCVADLKELIELARLGGMSEEDLFETIGKQTVPSFTDVSELFLLKTWGYKWRDLVELLVTNPDMYESISKRHKKADGQEAD